MASTKRQAQLGLVVEGNATASAILRLPGMAEELGPIKSAGLQVSRRISNFLKAGYAVTDYRDLESVSIVLLRLPDSEVPRVVSELAHVDLPYGRMAFVLGESWLMTETLAPLKARGAAIASVVKTPTQGEPSFIVEGDVAAARKFRRVLERCGAKTIEIRPGTKPLFFAANVLLTAVPVPVFQLAQKALRDSGISGTRLTELIEDLAARLVDTAQKGSRVNWGGPLAECQGDTAEKYLAKLRQSDPLLSEAMDELLGWAKAQISQRVKAASASSS